MNGYVYILKDEKDKFYIGSTSDLDRRICQHKQGHTQTTRNMANPVLVFKQQFDSLDLARKIERKIKNLKRKDYVNKIIKDGYIKMKVN